METSYFFFLVLPLGIFVVFLAGLVYYYANREEMAQNKLVKLQDKQEAVFKKELEKLDNLRREKSIDDITYERFKYILETDIGQKRDNAKAEFANLTDETEKLSN